MAQTDEPIQGNEQAANAGTPPPPEPAGPSDREMDRDARTWAMICHLAGLAFLLPIVPIIGCVLGPLIVWLLKREQIPFVNEQGKEALNFQMTMLIYAIISAVLILACCVGLIPLGVVIVLDILLTIMAALRVNEGQHYRYPRPFIIRFIK
jgi:uncharacterized Tic20 family protein